MKFVPPNYGLSRFSSLDVWHHPAETDEVVTTVASLVSDVADKMESEVGHELSSPLHLCIYRTNGEACGALGRDVPATMLMAPCIGPDRSLIVCQSPQADPRNGDWRRMQRHLAHELAHVMLADLTGGASSLGDGGRLIRVRPWFDEGFAEVAAAFVCARRDIIESYEAASPGDPWDEEELDGALTDIASPRRSEAFAEAVRRIHVRCRGGTLREVFHSALQVAPRTA